MSMFDKIGAQNAGIQGSPGPLEFQSNPGKIPGNYNSLKPMQ